MNDCISKRELKNFFEKGVGRLSLDNLYSLTGDLSSNNLINYLFQIANDSITEYNGRDNLDYLANLFSYVNRLLEVNPSINRKSIYKKIRKVYEAVGRTLDENKNKYDKYNFAEKQLEKVTNSLDDLYDSLENKESKNYDFINYIIDNAHNLEYAKKTFEETKNIVNIKDKAGVSLFNNITSKYLEAIQEPVKNREDILYYNNLVAIMSRQENFKLIDSDKKQCLEKAYIYLDSLKSKDKNFEKKKFWLENLISYIKDEKVTKEELLTNLGVKHDIPIFFSKDIEEEINLKKTPISRENYPDRYIVDEYVMSIDDQKTTTVDDCLSCRKLENGNYLLGIHTADILGYYSYQSNVIKEALKRVVPIYLDDEEKTNFPIFPYEIIKDRASLLENMPRLARSYFYEIDSCGEIVKSKFLKTIITNNEKANYKDTDNIIRNDQENMSDTLSSLLEVSKILAVNNNIKIPAKVSPSGKLESSTMRFINSSIASFFHENNYPCLYLNKTVEDQEEVLKLTEKIKDDKKTFFTSDCDRLFKSLNYSYPKTRYSLEGEQQGFDTFYYTTVTSPLRKASDILMNHALDICYFDNPTDKRLYELENLLKKQARYMNEKLDYHQYFAIDYEINKHKIKKR